MQAPPHAVGRHAPLDHTGTLVMYLRAAQLPYSTIFNASKYAHEAIAKRHMPVTLDFKPAPSYFSFPQVSALKISAESTKIDALHLTETGKFPPGFNCSPRKLSI